MSDLAEQIEESAGSTVQGNDSNDFQDSDYASCSESETWTPKSSLFEYVEQNGRRYHHYFGPDKNPMPSDELEQERLDIMHECINILGNKKTAHYAPADATARRVLDLGTGTGIWAIDYAQNHPDVEVRGIDLTPIQPTLVPRNCTFEIGDIEDDWTYKLPFDYINIRMLAQSVNDWDRLLGQCRRNLRPGGFLELGEYHFCVKSQDNTVPDDWPPKVLFEKITEALAKIGRISPRGDDLRAMLEKHGFQDIHVRLMKHPIGRWPKDHNLKLAGQLGAMELAEKGGYEAYGLKLLTSVLEMSVEDADALCRAAKDAHSAKEFRQIHSYFEYFSAYGRMPQYELHLED